METFINFIPNYDRKTTREYFQNSNGNLINTIFDSQGAFWSDNDRDRNIKHLLNYHKGFRCIRETKEERSEKSQILKERKLDIFFQYKTFISNLPITYTHFQVRKNFYLLGNEIIYPKRFGIQSYNLTTQKTQTLCELSSAQEISEAQQMICFDIHKTKEGDYLICSGKGDGSVSLYKLTSKEIERVKDFKSNITPKFENIVSKVISQGNSDEILTNYVKFIQRNGDLYLLTTSNNGYIKIFDLNNEMKQVTIYKCPSPVNNCDFSLSNDLLGCVGDSQFVDMFDTRTTESIIRFKSHYDYGIVIKFKPESEHVFATGNQDSLCKLWDLRTITNDKSNKMKTPLKTLAGHFDSIGDLTFTKSSNSKEQFLIYAENINYLHVYNLTYDTTQTLTYRGNFCGLAYNEELSHIYLGSHDTKSGILVYDKIDNVVSNYDFI